MSATLFDLDGTLTDPAVGITRSIVYALEQLDFPVPVESLNWCIGPPLSGSFGRLLGTDDLVLIGRAVEFYRERFSEVGLYENSVYEGIPECLLALRERGVELYVATSKPHVYAERIVRHFQLDGHFRRVYGSELDGTRAAKGDLLSYLVSSEGLDLGKTVMVGDRSHDVVGASEAGIPCIGVLYGYGSVEEFEGAVAVCEEPSRLAGLVLGALS